MKIVLAKCAVLASAVVLAAGSPVLGATWWVDAGIKSPGDGTSEEAAFRTIQEAVNAAAAGDTVRVKEGVYTGNGSDSQVVDAGDRAIRIEAVGSREKTIIDGEGDTRCFDADDTKTELVGFTLRNGYDTWGVSGADRGTLRSGSQGPQGVDDCADDRREGRLPCRYHFNKTTSRNQRREMTKKEKQPCEQK